MGNGDEIKDRLKAVLNAKNMSVSKITEGEEVKRSTLSAQINGSSAVSAETIKLFLKKFQDLSAEWLTRGIGSMFCGNETTIDEVFKTNLVTGDGNMVGNNIQGDNNHMGNDAVLQKENEMLKDQIAKQDKEIEFLRGLLNNK